MMLDQMKVFGLSAPWSRTPAPQEVDDMLASPAFNAAMGGKPITRHHVGHMRRKVGSDIYTHVHTHLCVHPLTNPHP